MLRLNAARTHPILLYLIFVFFGGWALQFFARKAQDAGYQAVWTALLSLFTILPGTTAILIVSLSGNSESSRLLWQRTFAVRAGAPWYLTAIAIGTAIWLLAGAALRTLSVPVYLNPRAAAAAPVL